jgi:NAD(P)H-flavin reductase
MRSLAQKGLDTSSPQTGSRNLKVYITNLNCMSEDGPIGITDDIVRDMELYSRRISNTDLRTAVWDEDPGVRANTVCYVCGPPVMTDEFVGVLQSLLEGEGGGPRRVFYEKWW